MAIVEMKKVFLFVHRTEKEEVVRALQSLGMVEIRQVQENPAWEEWQGYLTGDGDPDAVSRLENRLSEVKYALDFFARHFPVKKSFVQQFTGSKITLTGAEFATYGAGEDRVQEVYRACRKADERLTALRNEETRTRNLLADLAPYRELPVPLGEVGDTRRVSIKLGSVQAADLAGFQERLAEAAPETLVHVIAQDREQAFIFLIHLTGHPEVEKTLKECNWTALSVPENFTDTPAQCIAQLEEVMAGYEEERRQILAQVENVLAERPRLMAYYDNLALRRDRLSVTSNFGSTGQAVLITGWVRAVDVSRLEKELNQVSKTATLIVTEPEEGEVYPVALKNSPLVEPFEAVTNLYSTPNHREIDPTPALAPFFFVFFGIALGDAGYGILLSLLSLFLLKKLQPKGMGEQLIKLLCLGGVATLGFGILSGGWFGDLLPLPPLWFNPVDDPMKMLIVSLVLGVIHLYTGMGIQVYRSIKAGNALDALFDQGFWYLFLTGLPLLAFPSLQGAGKVLALVGAAGLILTQGRHQKNVFMKLISGVGSLYNVTGYLSDVLSYSRLLALGLAGGVIAVAINTMGRLVASAGVIGLVVMVLLLVGGHAFNLIISALGAFVHTSRLQYIEYFGKFFEGGGKAFTPFQIKTQYVDVEEREA
ncbi:MAG: V-type ATP synthase subunit I [bacterium]|jgi:V/A-type H+-transporting ATPase subunit I